MAGVTKSKTVKPIRFKDLPGLLAIPQTFSDLPDSYVLWDAKEEKQIGLYNDRTKHAFSNDVFESRTCKDLHQAMRWIYLKTKKPNKK